MEVRDRAAGNGNTPDSRRARREAAAVSTPSMASRRSARRTPQTTPAASRWIARTGVLASLALATIVVPMAAGADTGAPTGGTFLAEAVSQAPSAGKSTFEVLTTERNAQTTAVIVADQNLLSDRNLAAASRTAEREDVDSCVPVEVTSGNGLLTSAERCPLWQSGHSLQANAAVSLIALNDAYKVRFGTDMCITDSYRTLSSQYEVKALRGGFAAPPGTSQHGWGLAIDVCNNTYSPTAQWNWLKVNGPIFGWDNPAWARRGGSGAYEPWHWEYFPIVDAQSR